MLTAPPAAPKPRLFERQPAGEGLPPHAVTCRLATNAACGERTSSKPRRTTAPGANRPKGNTDERRERWLVLTERR